MDELIQALQSGQITPAQYEMMIKQMEMNGVMTRGVDTPQERDRLQGLLGGGQQQMGQATVEPEWQPPKYKEPIRPNVLNPMMGQQIGQQPAMPQQFEPLMRMPSAEPMTEISGRGAPTQNETDFLGQFVDNAKKAMGGRPNIDTPQQRDYIKNIMDNYNKRY